MIVAIAGTARAQDSTVATASAPAPKRKMHVALMFLPMSNGSFTAVYGGMPATLDAAFAPGGAISVGWEVAPGLTVGLAPQLLLNVKPKEDPITTDPAVLLRLAHGVAETVELRSGHGGLVSEYDPWWDGLALDEAFARARRFWGVDIDSMSSSLFVTEESIKGINWITLVAHPMMGRAEAGLGELKADGGIQVNEHRHGFVFVAGPQPLAGDRSRNDRSLEPYFRVALALAPLFPTTHPDISSSRFKASGLTTAWIRRFIEPAGWEPQMRSPPTPPG